MSHTDDLEDDVLGVENKAVEKHRERIIGTCTSEFFDVSEGPEQTENDPVTSERPKHESPIIKFWETCHEWAGFTTFHGIRYVFDEKSHIIRRSIWFIIIICMLIVLILIGQKQINRYFLYNTVITETVSVRHKLKFPSFTVCNKRFIRNDSVVNDTHRAVFEELMKSVPNKTRLEYELGALFINNTSFRELLVDHVLDLSDVVLSCKWNDIVLNCSEYFSQKLTENGICFTLSTSADTFDTALAGDGYGLEVTLWAGHDILLSTNENVHGVKIIVHGPSEEPEMELATLVGPGFMHYTAVTTRIYDYMSYPVLAVGEEYCVDTLSDVEQYGNYSVTSCLRKCRSHSIKKHCGCLSPFEFEDSGNDIDCSVSEMIDCYKATESLYMSQIEHCHCPPPCHITRYQTKHVSTYLPEIWYRYKQQELSINATVDSMRENLVLLKVFLENKQVTHHEQILEFTFEDLWASFGGYIGLAVGASFITFLEIVDLFVINAIHYFRNIGRLVRDPI